MYTMKGCEEEPTVESVSISYNEDTREIYLFGSIDGSVASQVISVLRQFENKGRGNIGLVMCSSGGSEASGWAIYDALCLSRCRIIGQCYGECMSIAVLVLQGCDSRLVAPNCRLMIHNGTINLGSTSQDKISNVNKEIETMTRMYYEKLAEKSELTVDRVKKLCDNETFMSAEEALKYGLIDGIIGQTKKRGKK